MKNKIDEALLLLAPALDDIIRRCELSAAETFELTKRLQLLVIDRALDLVKEARQ